MSSNIVTIESHIQQMQSQHPSARGEFSGLLRDITFATKIISHHVNRAGLTDILGATGQRNVQGESVQKLDDYAHEVMERMVGRGGRVCLMASEEREDPIPVHSERIPGDYVLLFDPLDGSSNIDVNVSIGTIFSVLRRVSPSGSPVVAGDLLQHGWAQESAGYVIYGSSTMMVFSAGHGVHGFTLDPTVGEFLLSHENIRIPKRGGIYSVNEGHSSRWDSRVRSLIESYQRPTDERPAMSGRYIGSLVADFHRNLLKGGIFIYPGLVDAASGETRPKLRLMYEANPLAFVVHHAGGYASDGTQAILDIHPDSLHQRVPLLIGSEEEVKEAERQLSASGKPA